MHISWCGSPLPAIWLKQSNLYKFLKVWRIWDLIALALAVIWVWVCIWTKFSPPPTGFIYLLVCLFIVVCFHEIVFLEGHYLSLAFIAVIHTMTKKYLGEEMVHFILYLSDHSPSLWRVKARTQGRNLEADTDARLWRNAAYWLAQFPMACTVCFFNITQDSLPKHDTACIWASSHPLPVCA